LLNVGKVTIYKETGTGKKAQEDERFKPIIMRIFLKSKRTYGKRRIVETLKQEGYDLGEKRVCRLMKELQISVKVPKKKFKPAITNQPTEDLIQRNFHPGEPGKRFSTDVTQIKVLEGWLYCCAVLDLGSRRCLGLSMRTNAREELLHAAILTGYGRLKFTDDWILHADRGSINHSDATKKLVSELGGRISASRKGNCYDNAPTESFFATMKKELDIDSFKKKSAKVVMGELFKWVELFYNSERLHSSLGYKSSLDYERNYDKR